MRGVYFQERTHCAAYFWHHISEENEEVDGVFQKKMKRSTVTGQLGQAEKRVKIETFSEDELNVILFLVAARLDDLFRLASLRLLSRRHARELAASCQNVAMQQLSQEESSISLSQGPVDFHLTIGFGAQPEHGNWDSDEWSTSPARGLALALETFGVYENDQQARARGIDQLLILASATPDSVHAQQAEEESDNADAEEARALVGGYWWDAEEMQLVPVASGSDENPPLRFRFLRLPAAAGVDRLAIYRENLVFSAEATTTLLRLTNLLHFILSPSLPSALRDTRLTTWSWWNGPTLIENSDALCFTFRNDLTLAIALCSLESKTLRFL